MALTDTAIRNTKPREKQFKVFDGRGLFLLIKPSGTKGWRFKYFYSGKEKLLAFGIYPEVSLKAAREQCDEARKLIAQGINPAINRKTSAAVIPLSICC